jgi:hypothetical protein
LSNTYIPKYEVTLSLGKLISTGLRLVTDSKALNLRIAIFIKF